MGVIGALGLTVALRTVPPVAMEEFKVLDLQVQATTDVGGTTIKGYGGTWSSTRLVYIVTAECEHGRRRVERIYKSVYEQLRVGGYVGLPACEQYVEVDKNASK